MYRVEFVWWNWNKTISLLLIRQSVELEILATEGCGRGNECRPVVLDTKPSMFGTLILHCIGS